MSLRTYQPNKRKHVKVTVFVQEWKQLTVVKFWPLEEQKVEKD